MSRIVDENGYPATSEIDNVKWNTGWNIAAKEKEMVNHPDHYKGKNFEVIDIIEDYSLGFCLGNAIKYILRCGKKDGSIQELEKAKWYLDRRITELRKESE